MSNLSTAADSDLDVPGTGSQFQPASQPASKPIVATAVWKKAVAEFQKSSGRRASWQLVNTLVPYALVWYLMYQAMSVSLWLAWPLAFLGGALLVRVFIIFHDCGHGSFFASRRANDFWGFVCGLLTLTPYYQWRWEHSVHHATAGHLDRRGTGDVWTLTVQEYLEASRWKRFAYRMARNPIILFLIAPTFFWLFVQRIPVAKANGREKRSAWWMNLAIVLMGIALSSIYGFGAYLVLQLTAVWVATSTGFWLFYVQHQFDDAYWERENWDYTAAALHGSSFYKLPRILQWFSGNIGFHHIHHLSPRIPNYNLERCHRSDPIFEDVKQLTLFSSLRLATLRLWDEHKRELIGFGKLREVRTLASVRSAQQESGAP